MRIAVAGGTGTIGRHVVDVARERGHEVVLLTRSAGVDLVSGAPAELTTVLDGVDVVVDTSNVATASAAKAEQFFTAVTRNLLAAERSAGVGHHVALSIVGIDRAPYGYYAGKLAQERAVEAGDVPWTILRATQFHEFAEQMLGRLTIAGIHLAPKLPTQPVAAREAAARLVDLAEGAPAGRAPDLAGPKQEELPHMIRRLADAMGVRGPHVPVALPMKQFRAMRRGAALPGPDAMLGRQTFDEWVAERAR